MRPLVLAAAVALAAGAWWLAARPPQPPAAAEPPASRRPQRGTGALATAPPFPERNVFEYAGRPTVAETPMRAAPPSVAPTPLEAIAPVPAPPPEPVRLVGLVHRGGRLRAVLSVQGEVAILAPGEEIQGYRVLAVDEERVRLQGPDGTERALARPGGD